MDFSAGAAEDLIRSGRLERAAGLTAAAAAEQEDATVRWLSEHSGVVESADGPHLVDGARSLVSSVGAVALRDRGLTRRFLAEAGVDAPAGQASTGREAPLPRRYRCLATSDACHAALAVGTGAADPEAWVDLEELDARVAQAATTAAASVPGVDWALVEVGITEDARVAQVLDVSVDAIGTALDHAAAATGQEPRQLAAQLWAGHRRSAEAEEPDGSPLPEVHPDLPSVGETLGDTWPRQQSHARLGPLVSRLLRGEGWEVAQHGSLRAITGPNGATLWITRSGATTQDRFGPRRVVRRHGHVRQLLAAAHVPRPRGRVLDSAGALRRTFGGTGLPLTAVPAGGRWDGEETRSVVVEDGRRLFRGSSRSWFVQSRLPGSRLRLFATRDEVPWMTAARPPKRRDERSLQVAADVAVAAVRAVPGLRWSAVDVVIRPPERGTGRPRVVVEGLSPNPRIDRSHRVVAGSFEQFARWIIASGVEVETIADDLGPLDSWAGDAAPARDAVDVEG